MLRCLGRILFGWLWRPFQLTDEIMKSVPDHGSHVSGSPVLRLTWNRVEGEYVTVPNVAGDELWSLRSRHGHPETMGTATMHLPWPSKRGRSATMFLMEVPEGLDLHEQALRDLADWWTRWRGHVAGPFRGGLDDL